MGVLDVRLDVLEPESCSGCGLCCLGIGSPPIYYVTYPTLIGPHPFRPPGLPDHLVAEVDAAFYGMHRGQEPLERCIWHDPATGLCRNYEWRPQVCRDYELGGRECLATRRPKVTRPLFAPPPSAAQPPPPVR
jgi:Fe-S-cluster containining protein